MPGLRGGSPECAIASLLPGARVDPSPEIVIGEGEELARATWDCSEMPFLAPRPATRPRVFVWPALLAVGGVERNTIEIMRQLREAYDFVVVTTERLTEQTGSLHHQLKGLATATYDLAECGPPARHLSMLATLKRVYAPDLVWICNGSPWQCDQALAIRAIYRDVPIVDQEAYDTRVGWITRYHEPGIQSFDRFIAINRGIREAFVTRLGMDPSKIDLIYPAFDGARFDSAAYPAAGLAARKLARGFPPDAPLFVFIGRMTAQKKPLAFLRLAAAVAATSEPAFFLMVGDGELAGEVDAFIRERTRGAVRRLPFTDQVPEILDLAEGLVLTSEYEGLPVVLLEALAMGRPALATDVGDVRLILEEYGSGALLPTSALDDESELLAAWQAWRNRFDAYREAAREAAPLVRERFGSARVAAQYDACWRKAMGGR
jgi:glycosyltransferase involved in cell wall biosynthesis